MMRVGVRRRRAESVGRDLGNVHWEKYVRNQYWGNLGEGKVKPKSR